MNPVRAILIAGPTAAGKSALALELARRHGGVVINADSMQVYRELRILTARPAERETAELPHALYGHVAAADAYSVGRWLADAKATIEGAWREGRMPVVVGGTGLYFKALLEGLAPIPEIAADIRAHWRQEADRLGPEALHRLLAARDPVTAARLRPSDPQRLARALEVLEATGRPLSAWQQEKGKPLLREEETERHVLAPPRAGLVERTDARLERMIAAGALNEVRRLAGLGLARDLPAMRAVGVPPLLAAVDGRLELAEAVARAKLDTRQYVKRQATWLRRNMMSWRWHITQ
jgi:tRNA dimethylallyltransferase